MPLPLPETEPPAVLDLANPDQIRAWADSLHISRTTLVSAVQAAGADSQSVLRYLRDHDLLD